MEYQKQIHAYMQEHKSEIIHTLKELIKIPSVRGEASAHMPFGRSCAEVLRYTEKLYHKNGFETELDEDGGYLLSYYGNGKKSLGLFAHADVVPVNDEWILTNPFEPIEKDGFIVGRGVLDDKAAVVISLYCAKILKELNIPFNSRLVMFTGANEESGMDCIKSYAAENIPPDFSLVPDTAFPLYFGDKGSIQLTVFGNNKLECITEINASNTLGAVLEKISVKLKYSDKLFAYLKGRVSERVSVDLSDNEIIISALGVSTHNALCESSLNAGGLVAEILKDCPYICSGDREVMQFLYGILCDCLGRSIGINNYDNVFGNLTMANDLIEFKDNKLVLHFSVRFGKAVDIDKLKATLKRAFSSLNFSVYIESEAKPHCIDIDNPLLKACLQTYREFTGDKNGNPVINAGGTYSRHLPCAIEVGTTLKWGVPLRLPKGHGGAHQPDECLNIEGFLQAIELITLMLIKCDEELN